MGLDNTFWITNSPEWDSAHTVCNDLDCWTGPVEDYTFSEKVDYVTKYRVYTVFTHPRDLLAVGIFALAITLIVVAGREIFKSKLLTRFVRWVNS
jgi:hypothetical protein